MILLLASHISFTGATLFDDEVLIDINKAFTFATVKRVTEPSWSIVVQFPCDYKSGMYRLAPYFMKKNEAQYRLDYVLKLIAENKSGVYNLENVIVPKVEFVEIPTPRRLET